MESVRDVRPLSGKRFAIALAILFPLAGVGGAINLDGVPQGPGTLGASAPVLHAAAETADIAWVRQFGSSSFDYAYSLAVDDSGVYLSGGRVGIRKYDVNGNEVWAKPVAHPPRAITVNPSGVYAGGFGEIRRYDFDGNELWIRQLAGSIDSITVDASGVYVAGTTEGVLPGQISSGGFDTYVRKYDLNGNELWTRQFGSSGWDVLFSLAIDASHAYMVGHSNGTLPGQTNSGGYDAFVRAYDLIGNELWTR
ncbi:MAG: hypothetical protein ACT4OI_09685, partial [Methanobacteriota archaeon]